MRIHKCILYDASPSLSLAHSLSLFISFSVSLFFSYLFLFLSFFSLFLFISYPICSVSPGQKLSSSDILLFFSSSFLSCTHYSYSAMKSGKKLLMKIIYIAYPYNPFDAKIFSIFGLMDLEYFASRSKT